jgi:hypothetical protein
VATFTRQPSRLDDLNVISEKVRKALEDAGLFVEIEFKYAELDGYRFSTEFTGRIAEGKAKRSRSKLDQKAVEAGGQAGEEEGRQELSGVEGPRTARRRSFQRAATLARK